MTIPEEIEQLKLKLEQTADEREEAEILLEILEKSDSINNTETDRYINRLSLLSKKLNDPLHEGWSLYFFSATKKIKSENDDALNLIHQALAIFKKINHQFAIACSYNKIGRILEDRSDYQEALKFFLLSLEIFEEIGRKQHCGNVYSNIGNVKQKLGNYPEAIKNYLKALKLVEESEDKSALGNIYGNISVLKTKVGNYAEALEYTFLAIKIFKENNDKIGTSKAYNSIGVIYDIIGNISEAITYYLEAIKIGKETGDKSGLADAYSNLGIVYSDQGNLTGALEALTISLELQKAAGDKSAIVVCLNSVGSIYQKQNNHTEALKTHLAALKLAEEINAKNHIGYCLYHIASVHDSMKNFTEALKKHLSAVQIGEEIKNKGLICSNLISLSAVCKNLGDFESSLKYYEKYHEIQKEILGEESTKQLNQLSFTHNLEQKEKDLEIEQLRNVELKKERDRSESLLLNILPAEVAEELKEKGTANAKHFDNVTVLFTDFKGFTTVSEKLTPQQLVDELHACFSGFDAIISKYNIEKIKTVGDAYLAVSGLPLANANHAEDMVKAAIEIRDFMLERKGRGAGGEGNSHETFEVRIGIHSGSVVAGIVGVKKFAYDIWGDTVNTAARMEQNGEAGKVNISEATYGLVKDKFNCEYRGEIEAKNKGKLKMYFIV